MDTTNTTWFEICCMSSQEFEAYTKKRFTAFLLRFMFFLVKIMVRILYYVVIFSVSYKLYEGKIECIDGLYQKYLILPSIHFVFPTFYRGWLFYFIKKIIGLFY